MKKRFFTLWLPMIFLILVVLGAGAMLCRELYVGEKEQDAFDTLAEVVYEETLETPPPSAVALLREQYPDVCGWMRIEGTVIDYPVVHTPGHSEKYLRMDLEGNYARSGVPFLDGRIGLDSPHLIIYGHNMLNGTMFSDLTKYTTPAFAAEHDIICLSLEAQERRYRIFAVIETDGQDAWYKAMDFSSPEEYQKQLSALSLRSLYKGELPEKGQLLTLSTCTGLRQQKRLLVIAAQID